MHNNAADARYELAQVSTFLLQTLAEVVEAMVSIPRGCAGAWASPSKTCRTLPSASPTARP